MDCDESLPEDETIQDVPMILNQELRDIFPIFASMLDVKSFMKLAMTSKDMYKRCMEDKSIRINVDENFVYGNFVNQLDFKFSVVSDRFTNAYLSTLKKMRSAINLRTVAICNYMAESLMVESTRRYLAEIGVKRIEKLSLGKMFSEWDEAISLIKDFHVNVLTIDNLLVNLPVTTLRSLLQQNLKEFSYNEAVSVADILFEISSPIPRMSLIGTGDISKEIFMQILWIIQSGSLAHLTLSIRAVDWRAYDKLPFYHHDALPDDRPLLFARTPNNSQIREYWFLHWQGGVTKCVADTIARTLEVFKCEPNDLPLALRKDEDVMKDLTEMRSGVSCLLKHFRTFSASLTMLEPSLKGRLPCERPLYFKASQTSFWRLDNNDSLKECAWENGCVTWKPFMPRGCLPFAHPELAKYMFWKLLKEKTDFPFILRCEGNKEFNSWFEDYETFGYEYIDPLPNERPLVFGGHDRHMRYVLFDDVWFEISYAENEVHVEQHEKWRQREVTYNTIKDILQNTSSHCANAYVNIRVSLKTFRDGLEAFESIKEDRGPFVWRSMRQIDGILMKECWYCYYETIRKVVWSEGRLGKSPGHLHESPLGFIKMIFKEFAIQGKSSISMFLNLKQFQSCLDQFTVVPFDHSGSLKIDDFPLAFVKNEGHHTCDNEKPLCQCSNVIIHVRFLWDHMVSTHCSWGEEEPKKILFKTSRDSKENIPAALKSKEYLKMLLEASYDSDTQYDWLGDINDFLAFFNGFKKFPFDYKGRLPKERPLVFENNSIAKEPVRFFLREDNSVVKCKWSSVSKKEAHLSLPRCKRLAPRATWEFL